MVSKLLAIAVGLLAVGWVVPPKPPGLNWMPNLNAVGPAAIAAHKSPLNHVAGQPSALDLVSRPYEQTFAAQSEWFVVDLLQEQGRFIESRPFYDFDYIGSVASYWQRLYYSTRAGVAVAGILPVVCSAYFVMQLFMGTIITVNFGAVGAISVPIRLLIGGAEPDLVFVEFQVDAAESASLHSLLASFDRRIHQNPDLDALLKPDGKPRIVGTWFRRYRNFLVDLAALAHSPQLPSLRLISVAGHTNLAVKFRAPRTKHWSNSDIPPPNMTDTYSLGDWDYRIAQVTVSQLFEMLKQPRTSSIWQLEHAFDF
jgi:hypothetical protein